jgi:hypothetical protein
MLHVTCFKCHAPLQALCAARLERAEAGDHEEMESLGIGLLEQCLIDPETGEVGLREGGPAVEKHQPSCGSLTCRHAAVPYLPTHLHVWLDDET